MAQQIDLFYGPTGSGKSRAILELITRMYRQTRKQARVYVGDGSAMYRNSGLVEAGVIHLTEYASRIWPLTATQQMTDGMWPVDPEDPTSKFRLLTPEERAETGLWVFEGVSVMGQYMMGHIKGGLAWQASQGVKIGGDANVAFQDAEVDATTGRYMPNTGSGQKWGGSNLAHYMVAQGHMLDRIQRSKSLPGWVIWTGHEIEADDQQNGGEKVIGPEMAGKAKSANLPRLFDNTLHFTVALKNQGRDKQKDQHTGVEVRQTGADHRIYWADHYDPDGLTPLRYKAGTRCPLPEMLKPYYAGKPGVGIVEFFTDMEMAKAESVKRALEGLAPVGVEQGVAS